MRVAVLLLSTVAVGSLARPAPQDRSAHKIPSTLRAPGSRGVHHNGKHGEDFSVKTSKSPEHAGTQPSAKGYWSNPITSTYPEFKELLHRSTAQSNVSTAHEEDCKTCSPPTEQHESVNTITLPTDDEYMALEGIGRLVTKLLPGFRMPERSEGEGDIKDIRREVLQKHGKWNNTFDWQAEANKNKSLAGQQGFDRVNMTWDWRDPTRNRTLQEEWAREREGLPPIWKDTVEKNNTVANAQSLAFEMDKRDWEADLREHLTSHATWPADWDKTQPALQELLDKITKEVPAPVKENKTVESPQSLLGNKKNKRDREADLREQSTLRSTYRADLDEAQPDLQALLDRITDELPAMVNQNKTIPSPQNLAPSNETSDSYVEVNENENKGLATPQNLTRRYEASESQAEAKEDKAFAESNDALVSPKSSGHAAPWTESVKELTPADIEEMTKKSFDRIEHRYREQCFEGQNLDWCKCAHPFKFNAIWEMMRDGKRKYGLDDEPNVYRRFAKVMLATCKRFGLQHEEDKPDGSCGDGEWAVCDKPMPSRDDVEPEMEGQLTDLFGRPLGDWEPLY